MTALTYRVTVKSTGITHIVRDKDHIRVERSHPLFAAVAVAVVADLEKSIARCEKRGASEWVKNYSRDLANLRAMLALN